MALFSSLKYKWLDRIFATTTMTSPQCDQRRSLLLGLPPEIRNIIYRFVLVTRGPVEIGLPDFNEPGILATCKQTRLEASTIFYNDNNFKVLLEDYNALNGIKWQEKIKAAVKRHEICGKVELSASFVGTSVRNWDNLVEWCKAYHAGLTNIKFPAPSQENAGDLESMTIGGIFVMLEVFVDQPWHEVEKILPEQRTILGKIAKPWND